MEFLFAREYLGMSLFEIGAMVTVLLQVWYYGKMSLLGPITGMVGCLMWITMGLRADPPMIGLVALNAILFLINIKNYVQWSKAKETAMAGEAA